MSRLANAALALYAVSAASAQTAPSCPTPPAGEDKPWLNTKYSPECRARFVLNSFKTLDEKFAFLSAGGGGGRGGPNPLDNLGLHRGGGSDGPAGVRAGTGVTAFPTPLSIAATFDPAMGTRFGDLMGQDFFDAGLNGVTGPAIDIARTWHFGRATESFGEDPFLAGSIAGPEIAAIQAHRVLTTMKHYAAYNQEQNRSGDQPTGSKPANNEIMSERALRESVGEPPRVLKGIGKVALQPGEEKTVQVKLDADAFRYWDEGRKAWALAPGAYQVMVGRSSRDIAWTGSVTPAAK